MSPAERLARTHNETDEKRRKEKLQKLEHFEETDKKMHEIERKQDRLVERLCKKAA